MTLKNEKNSKRGSFWRSAISLTGPGMILTAFNDTASRFVGGSATASVVKAGWTEKIYLSGVQDRWFSLRESCDHLRVKYYAIMRRSAQRNTSKPQTAELDKCARNGGVSKEQEAVR